jgi:E3 ubiquitin-protein ligase HERC2
MPVGAIIMDISCGLGHALFLCKSRKVYSSGSGGNGRLGLGDTGDRKEPCLIHSLSGELIAAVQCGASHSLAVSATGKVYCWGKNTQGQCGVGHLDELSKPTLNKTLSSEKVIQVGAGWEHSIALTDKGTVYAWGSGYKDNRRGIVPPVLGLGDNEGRTLPERLSSFDSIVNEKGLNNDSCYIVNIACGWDHCLALDNMGQVRSWGSGQNGKLGRGNEESVAVPSIIKTLRGVCVISISAGCEHSAAITDEGLVYTWGHGDGKNLYVLYVYISIKEKIYRFFIYIHGQ